ncbi:MAG: helix-turn-helix transcriptional regulator [Pseudomonadota bacterium]
MSRTRKNENPELSLRLTFARNVRLVRVHQAMSQERLADEAGLDRTFIGTLERGLRNISIDNIELISHAVGISAQEMLDPALAEKHGLDVTLTRAPRTVRAEPIKRRKRIPR